MTAAVITVVREYDRIEIDNGSASWGWALGVRQREGGVLRSPHVKQSKRQAGGPHQMISSGKGVSLLTGCGNGRH
ncbi:hypothetical protein SLA2020_187710 [Shorea laevis]